MKYVLVFLALLLCMLAFHALGRAGRAQLYRDARPMLRFSAISAAAVLAVILIAYFGGHIRVL